MAFYQSPFNLPTFNNIGDLREFGRDLFEIITPSNNDDSVGFKILNFAKFVMSCITTGLKSGVDFAKDFISNLVSQCTAWLSNKVFAGVKKIINADVVYGLIIFVVTYLVLAGSLSFTVMVIVESLLLFFADKTWKKIALAILNAISLFKEGMGKNVVSVNVINNHYSKMQAPGGNVNKIIYNACLLLAVVTTTWLLPATKDFSFFINYLDKVPKAIDGMKNMTEKFDYALKYFQKVLGLELIGADVSDPLPTEVRENFESVMELCNLDDYAELASNVEKANEIEVLYNTYMNLRMKYFNNRLILGFLDQYQGAIVNLWSSAINSNPMESSRRVKPVVMFLRGATQVGKSTLLYFFGTDMLRLLDSIKPEMSDREIQKKINTCMYNRMIEQEFYDAWLRHLICLFDDFGQMKDSISCPNKEYMELIRAANTFPFPLHMAALSQKNNSFFESKFIMATTNLQTIDPVSLTDPSAVRARIDVGYEVTIDNDVRKNPLSDIPEERVISPQKVLAKYGSSLSVQIYRFHPWNTATGEVDYSKDYTYDQVWADIAARYRDNLRLHQEAQAVFVDHARREVPEPVRMQCGPKRLRECVRVRMQSDDAEEDHDRLQNVILERQMNLLETLRRPISRRNRRDMPNYDHRIAHEEYVQGLRQRMSYYERLKAWIFGTPETFRGRCLQWLTDRITEFKSLPWYAQFVVLLGMGVWIHRFVSIYGAAKALFEYTPDRLVVTEGAVRFCLVNTPRALACLVSESNAEMFVMRRTVEAKYGLSCIQLAEAYVRWFGRIDMDLVMNGSKQLVFPYDKDYETWISFNPPDVEIRVDEWCLLRIADLAKTLLDKPRTQTEKFDIVVDVVEERFFNVETGQMEGGQKLKRTPQAKTVSVTKAATVEYSKPQVVPKAKVEYGKPEVVKKAKIEYGKPEVIRKATVEADDVDAQVELVKAGLPIISLEAYRSQQSMEVSRHIRKNYMLLRDSSGKKICPVLFVKGRHAIINYHYAAGIIAHMDEVKLTPINSEYGYKLSAKTLWESGCQLARGDNEDFKMDLFLMRFDKRIPMFADITKNFLNKKDLAMTVEKEVVFMTPIEDTFIFKTGKCKQILTQPIPTDFEVQKGINFLFDVRTEPGDCGGVYIVDDNLFRGKIIALHYGGHDQGGAYACPLIYEDFEHIEDFDVQLLGLIPVEQDTYFDVKMQGRIAKPVHSSTETKFGKTPFYNSIFESDVRPAQLSHMMKEGGAGIKALAKVVGDVPNLDEDLLTMATENYKEVLFRHAIKDRRQLPFEEAVRGEEGDPYIKGINRTKSAGYPWSQVHKNGKREWFGKDQWTLNGTKPDQVRETIKEWHRCADEGIYVPSPYVDTLKDETRSNEKVDAGKTRLFSAAPMHYVILFRMYFLTFLKYCMEHRIDNGCAVGIRSQSPEWHKLSLRLKKFGGRVAAGDFKNYDGTLHPLILLKVLHLADCFYKDTSIYRQLLFEDVMHSWHVFCNLVLLWSHSQPSGNPGTAVFNSLYFCIALRYVYYRLAQKNGITPPEFNDNVLEIAYGDDSVAAISQKVLPWFNQRTIAEGFAEIGMEYTLETKVEGGDMPEWRPLEEVTFLKRGFRFENTICMYTAPLAISSILERTNWIKQPNRFTPDMYLEMFRQIKFELALHDQETYKYWSEKINEGLDGYLYLPEYPRIYYLTMVLQDRAFELCPDLAFC